MFFLDYTNQTFVYVLDCVQVVILLILCLLFVFRRKKGTVFMKVYAFMLAYLCGMAGIKLVFDLVHHDDSWYRPYIASSIMLVPVMEGLMYSLYRQGTSLVKVLRRILISELPFFVIILMTITIGYHSWYKTVAYTYLAVFSFCAFVITLIRVRLFSRQVRQAYSDADERSLMWIRPVLVIAAVLLMTFAVSLVFVFAWVRIAFDAVSLFIYAAVGFYIMRQKPVDSSLVDATRMYLQGDMVDRVQVRVRDSKGDFVFVNISEKLTREGMISLGKKLDQFMTNSVDCLKHGFTIAELAEKMGVDNVFLSCYIANELEMDFYTYVNDFRIDYATKLIESDKNMPLEEVSEKAGFNKIETFSSLFEKRHNCNPGLYREQAGYSFREVVQPLYDMCAEKRPNFVTKLKALEPSLSEKELACCMLMVLGYTVTRSAVFLGTTEKSLEITKCRLRSKLGLLHTDSLETFVERV